MREALDRGADRGLELDHRHPVRHLLVHDDVQPREAVRRERVTHTVQVQPDVVGVEDLELPHRLEVRLLCPVCATTRVRREVRWTVAWRGSDVEGTMSRERCRENDVERTMLME